MGLIYFLGGFTLLAAIILVWALIQLWHNGRNQQMETT